MAASVSEVYPFFAPTVGALCAFLAGSNTVSNLMLSQYQYSVAQALGVSGTTMVAAQSVGAAAGNMIAIHNVVAASATVGVMGREGLTLRRTILPTIYYVVVAGMLTIISMYVLKIGELECQCVACWRWAKIQRKIELHKLRLTMDIVLTALQSGLASLASYLAAHVLLCLVPAFFIAGALSALVPQQSIVRFLGPAAPKWVAYPAAAGAGSLLAVCSCTVQPLFAGIYSKGAGLGPAITFMFFAPAANILALSYTGVALGADFAVARLVLSLVFGIGIGMIMALIFHRSDAVRLDNAAAFAGGEGISRQTLIFLGALVVLLVGGTLKLDFLTTPLLRFEQPWIAAVAAQNVLNLLVPIDLIKGDEGLSVQGVVLIGMLGLIALTAWRGLGKVDEGFNRLTFVALGLIAATLIFAALGIVTNDTGWPLSRRFDAWDRQQWLWETWRFVKMIFPLLVVGVFIVGVIRIFIRPEWVQAIAGSNSVLANMAGVVFGVFMYFPTLVEVPIAKMFLSLGMHPGPLIAYLMADPELSLQSILITSAIIGKLKAWTYVGLVAVFSTLAGLTYGAWTDGTSITTVAFGFVAFIAVLFAALHYMDKRQHAAPAV